MSSIHPACLLLVMPNKIPCKMQEKTMKKNKEKTGKGITGKHVLLYVVGFFLTIFIANGFFIYFAVDTFRGEDNKRSYRQGIEYNKTIARRRHQQELGWKAKIEIADNALFLSIKDAKGAPISGLKINAILKHPAEMDLDKKLKFTQDIDNKYVTNLDKSYYGKNWILDIEAISEDGERFKSRNKIWLKQQ